MIRVMIVDDEYLVRERVKRCIGWEKLGFEIVAEADNGQDALALMREAKPQVVVTDISMPYINGLDFSKVIQEKHPQCKVLILTGYGSFDYARTALNAGVCGYLLKPIKPGELQSAIEDIRAQIEREAQLMGMAESSGQNDRMARSARRERLFETVLAGSANGFNDKIRGRFSQEFPDLLDGPLAVFLIKIHYTDNRTLRLEDRDLWRFAVENIFCEILCGKFEHVEICAGAECDLVVLVNTSGEDMESILCLCETAVKHILSLLGIPVTAGAGNPRDGYSGIADSYREAAAALESRIIRGKGRVIRFVELTRIQSETPVPKKFRDGLLISLRLGAVGAARDSIHELFLGIGARGQSVEALRMAVANILLCMNEFAREKGLDIREALEGNVSIGDIIGGRDTLDEIEAHLMQLLGKLAGSYSSSHLLSHSGLVTRAKRYIESNFADNNVTLDIIAGNTGANASHLSSVFKRESGYSVIEYLTLCRMDKAKDLMDSGGVNLMEISEASGFNDPYYFSKCFKKKFGISPSQYIKAKII